MFTFRPRVLMSQAGSFIKGGSSSVVQTLTGNTGGPISPIGNNINTVGDAVNITATGNAGTATITFSIVNTTQHSLQLGNASGGLSNLGVATNGQLPIGSTGADPVLAGLTAGANIAITNGAGSITIAANSTSQTVEYVAVTHGSSPYAALATDFYIAADVTGGVITVQLPNAPTTGRIFVIKDKVGLAATSNITVTTVGGVVNIDGATTFVMNTAYEAVSLLFNGTSYEVY